MRCQICQRRLGATEPVWHVRLDRTTIWREVFKVGCVDVAVACKRCKAKPPKGAEYLFGDAEWYLKQLGDTAAGSAVS